MQKPRRPSFRWTSLLVLFCVTSIAAAADDPQQPAPPEPETRSTLVRKSSVNIIIDGALTESCWADAEPIPVVYLWGKVGVAHPEPVMTARFTWDDRYLYIGYEVIDRNLTAEGKQELEGPPGNLRQGVENWILDHPPLDLAEFFISFGDPHFFWELHHNPLNHFSDIWCVAFDPSWPVSQSSIARHRIHFGHREFIVDEAQYTLATATQLRPRTDGSVSTVNNPEDVDTGYTGELRLPWLGLGAPRASQTRIELPPQEEGGEPEFIPGPWLMAGVKAKIFCVYQDGDAPERYFHSSPTLNSGWFHRGYDDWPTVEFVK